MDEPQLTLNDDGFSLRSAAVSDLLLDLDNPRIRLLGARNQRDVAVQIYLSKSDQLYHLARDICENGMTIMPIVVTDNRGGTGLIVKDGNRRIAALKLVRQPDWLPDGPERQRFQRLKRRHAKTIPERITVYHCNDPKRIALFIDRLHTGTGQGEGQLEWSAVEKSLFELDLGKRGQNDLAARLLRMALELGIPFNAEFPITTLTRLLNSARLRRLGIRMTDGGTLELTEDETLVTQRLRTLLEEIGRNEVHVRRDDSAGSIYSQDAQEAYLDRLLERHPSPPSPSPASSDETAVHDGIGTNVDTADEDSEPTSSRATPEPASTPVRRPSARSPRKDPYDRAKVIQRKEHKINLLPHADPPEKALAIYQELSKLRSVDTPIAIGMAIRALLEIATDHCITALSIQVNDGAPLAKKVKSAADAMHKNGSLSRDGKDAAHRLASADHYLSVASMNKIVHNDHFPANGKMVNQLWDQVLPFIQAALNQRRE